jgi:hypothetical protein
VVHIWWLHRLRTLEGILGDTLIHQNFILRTIGNWLTQRFISLHCWLAQGLYWCRVSNNSLFLRLLHLLMICFFSQALWGWIFFLRWVFTHSSPSLILRMWTPFFSTLDLSRCLSLKSWERKRSPGRFFWSLLTLSWTQHLPPNHKLQALHHLPVLK